MANFKYEAIQNGSVKKGSIVASSQDHARALLTEEGLWVSSLKATKGGSLKGIKKSDILNLFYQWRSMTKAGIPVLEMIEQSASDSESDVMHEALMDIYNNIESGGMQLHECMACHPGLFDEGMVNTVFKGEETGTLVQSYDSLIKYHSWLDETQKEAQKQLIGPVILLIALMGFVALMFGFVIPTIMNVVKSLHVELPWITVFMMGVNDFVSYAWPAIIAVMILFWPAVMMARKNSEAFRYRFDKFKVRAPVFGRLNEMISASRFSHNISGLYEAGVPLIEGLPIAIKAIGNSYLERKAWRAFDSIKVGGTMSDSFNKEALFTSMVRRMISTGELTGTLGEAMANVSDHYDREVPRVVTNIMKMVEPAITLIFGGVMAVLMLSFFLPVYSIISKMVGGM